MAAQNITKFGKKTDSKPPTSPLGHLFGESTRKTGLDADWNQVQPDVLLRIVWAVDHFGGAVTFSTTKKNTAYCIKVYLGAPQNPVYFDGDEEGRAALAEWADLLVQAVAEHG